MIGFLKKLLNLFRRYFEFLFLSKKQWVLPKKNQLLFFDRIGYEVFEADLARYQPTVLDVRGEVLNIPIFILSLLKGSWKNYTETFIQYVHPKLIITFIDNNPKFYELKSKLPWVTTMFVQNGFRGEIGDIFGYLQKKESYFVDYMVTFGSDIGKKYAQYIKGTAFPIGSFKNNKTSVRNTNVSKKKLLFISQFITPSSNLSEPFFSEQDGSKYYWDQFYEAEYILLPFLKGYCLRNDLSLRVCGRSKKENQEEVLFYKSFFDGIDWSMTSNENTSYEVIDSYELIVFVDSTLGYEALARGKKAAAFPVRCKSLQNDSYRFGWPGNFSETGSYWTNSMDTSHFGKVLDYLRTVSDEDWKAELTKSNFSNLMQFDPGNSKFIKLVDQILSESSTTKL